MARALGKIILTGEHAVVYGKPGIALPIKVLYTLVTISKGDYGYDTDFQINDDEKNKLEQVLNLIYTRLAISIRNFHIEIESNIPKSSGLGSSASLSVALVKEFSKYFQLNLSLDKINSLAFECEKIFHGKPSGIDNSVICYEKPIFFHNGIKFIELKKPLCFVIANTGIKSNTKEVIENLKPNQDIFSEIGKISEECKIAIEEGNLQKIGKLITRNHQLLGELGVSCIELDALVNIALKNGAYGAKLVGAGKGGNIAALITEKKKEKIIEALKQKARNIFYVVVS